jgi:hypothetical protein
VVSDRGEQRARVLDVLEHVEQDAHVVGGLEGGVALEHVVVEDPAAPRACGPESRDVEIAEIDRPACMPLELLPQQARAATDVENPVRSRRIEPGAP